MKKIAWLMPITLLLCSAAHAADPADTPPRTVSVDGQGEVSVQPDRAQLSLAVDAVDPDLKKAETKVNAVVRAYLADARKLGAADKDISTAGISVSPEYVWDNDAKQQKLVGYRARRDINITVTQLDRLGDFVLQATEAGVNHVNSPVLESSRADALRREALAQAATDARDKARLLADTLGMKLGAVRSLNANDSEARPPVPMMMMAKAARAPAADSGNSEMGFASGEIKYSANVSAQFDLLP
ncbi:SIMPL domain-containing protein [Solimonas marina]|uniref:SIMPL domain-containing protein n=1 Tax=Solimonas marina TaxID=2714601 RepID=A0A970B7H4_9GAMM|nr:SIMPL domain-containing protein [Solimonas marina]NKF21204.1 SIMPL domain-containing protein [Solimonas marina]